MESIYDRQHTTIDQVLPETRDKTGVLEYKDMLQLFVPLVIIHISGATTYYKEYPMSIKYWNRNTVNQPIDVLSVFKCFNAKWRFRSCCRSNIDEETTYFVVQLMSGEDHLRPI